MFPGTNFYSLSETPPGPVPTTPCDVNHCYDVTDVCSITCAPEGFVCTCANPERYGQTCQNRDGGSWTSWTFWSECFLTCNTQTRDRVCEEPAPLGDGMPCPGLSDESQDCSATYDCSVDFAYQFEALSNVCDVAVHEDYLSADDCIVVCQNDVQCSGILYDNDVCKRYEGKTESYNMFDTRSMIKWIYNLYDVPFDVLVLICFYHLSMYAYSYHSLTLFCFIPLYYPLYYPAILTSY